MASDLKPFCGQTGKPAKLRRIQDLLFCKQIKSSRNLFCETQTPPSGQNTDVFLFSLLKYLDELDPLFSCSLALLLCDETKSSS